MSHMTDAEMAEVLGITEEAVAQLDSSAFGEHRSFPIPPS
jgi:hypothetical protein